MTQLNKSISKYIGRNMKRVQNLQSKTLYLGQISVLSFGAPTDSQLACVSEPAFQFLTCKVEKITRQELSSGVGYIFVGRRLWKIFLQLIREVEHISIFQNWQLLKLYQTLISSSQLRVQQRAGTPQMVAVIMIKNRKVPVQDLKAQNTTCGAKRSGTSWLYVTGARILSLSLFYLDYSIYISGQTYLTKGVSPEDE